MTFIITGNIKDINGLPSPISLVGGGAFLPTELFLPRTGLPGELEYLRNQHTDVKLMLDTGAAHTCIDINIIKRINAKPIGMTKVRGVSGIAEDRPVFRLSLQLFMADEHQYRRAIRFTTDVRGIPPLGHAAHLGLVCDGLIGRDFLRYFKLVYTGYLASWELSAQPDDADG